MRAFTTILLFLLHANLWAAKMNNRHTHSPFVNFISFDYRNRLIYLETSLNTTKKKYRFMLDSGAPSFVSNELAERENLKSLSEDVIYDFYGRERNAASYFVNNISLSGTHFSNVKMWDAGNSETFPPLKNADGIIGTSLLNQAIWEIDYSKKIITVTNCFDSLHVPPDAVVVPLQWNAQGCPVVRVSLSGMQTLNVLIDLGYNGSLMLPAKYSAQAIYSSSETLNQLFTTGFQSSEMKLTNHLLNYMQLGNFRADQIPCTTTGNFATGILGNQFLEKFVVVIDYSNRRFVFYRQPTSPGIQASDAAMEECFD